jgi:hypothetical protein
MLLRLTVIGAFVTVWIGCEPTDDRAVTLGRIQAGHSDVSAAVLAHGACMGGRDNLWSYVAETPEEARVIVTKLPKAADEFLVQLIKKEDYLAQGFVHLDTRAIFWHESISKGDGEPSPANTITPLYAAQAEWNTPRGQVIVNLVSKAKENCEKESGSH